jgi:MATE family multidrug resistance protein
MIHTPRQEIKIILFLAIPLILTGIIEASVNFTSTYFLAQLGPDKLAAGSLVSWFYAGLLIIMWGAIMAVTVLVARFDGAKNTQAVAGVLRDGLYLCLILIIPSFVLLWNLAPILILFGQKTSVVQIAVPYMHALAWSVIPDYFLLLLLQFVIGLGHTRTNLMLTLFWVPVNILSIYALVFGKWGFPKLGIEGLGWGITLTYWVSFLALLLYMPWRKVYRQYFCLMFKTYRAQYLGTLFKVGLPNGLMWFVEIITFFVISLLMGHYSVAILGANQVTMQFVAFFVSVVFAMAQAITVRVGNQLGAKHYFGITHGVIIGTMFSVAIVLLTSTLYWFAPHWLLSLDFKPAQVKNRVIEAYAVKFFAIAAIFQLFEAVRISIFGALRAMNDTAFPLLTSFICFWGLALPVGYCLAHLMHVGPTGYWWGLAGSAALNIVLLVWRYCWHMRKLALPLC